MPWLWTGALVSVRAILPSSNKSSRRAAVLSYISSLLLRTLPQIDAEGPAGIIEPTKPVPTNVTLPDENADSDEEEEDDSDSEPADDAATDSETQIEAETETAAETDTQLDSANTWDPSIPEPDPKKKPS